MVFYFEGTVHPITVPSYELGLLGSKTTSRFAGDLFVPVQTKQCARLILRFQELMSGVLVIRAFHSHILNLSPST